MKISIIIPVYNVKEYLVRAVSSICNQTHRELEIILVDDGSTDGSDELCDELAKADDRIIVAHKKNGGASEARNYGLNIASGELIGFVDADDYIDDSMYEKMLLAMSEYGADCVSCGNVIEDIDSATKMYCSLASPVCFSKVEAFETMLLKQHMDISCYTKLFRRKVIGRERFKVGIHTEDLHFLYRVLHNCNKVVCIGEPYYHIYCREGSSSRVKDNPHVLDPIFTLSEMKKFVYSNYPELILQMDNFYLIWIVDTYRTLNSPVYSGRYYTEKRNIRVELKKYMGRYLKNRYIDKTYKFLLTGIYIRVFSVADFILRTWFVVKRKTLNEKK